MCATRVRPTHYPDSFLSVNTCLHLYCLDIRINLKLLTLPVTFFFNFISNLWTKGQREELIYSMIMRSENATLKDSDKNKSLS